MVTRWHPGVSGSVWTSTLAKGKAACLGGEGGGGGCDSNWAGIEKGVRSRICMS
jgi:hypothetical protein